MTVPRGIRDGANRVSEMVMGMWGNLRNVVTQPEARLAPHLRGNELLYEALTGLIRTRIEGRARLALPSTPLEAYASMARDKECQWLLSRLEFIYHAPVQDQEQDDGERPEE